MADEQPPQSTPRAVAVEARSSGPGFFTIYKRGQGYWTRMGTAIAAALLSIMLAQFVYTQAKSVPTGKDALGNPTYLDVKICAGVALAVLAGLALLCWRLMNKPDHVDFLIATDSEMKKVNWTTRKELIGSTKVVIFFVILISVVLFLLDVIFGYLFQLIRVLEFGPFGQ